MNLTDGMLTFFFAATLLAAFATLRRSAAGRPTAGLAAATGALAAAGFLTKGLIAIVLPGGILLVWSALAGRMRSLRALLLSPAPVVFLALAAPWPILAERAHPGFLEFFFIHEHFQRFATPAASRPGPITYFVGVFLAGFLPGLPFFFRGAREAGRRDPVSLFLLVWFAVVLVFFSISQSKLPPYIFPALPAAAALAARGLSALGRPAAAFRWHAALVAVLFAALALVPDVRRNVVEHDLVPLAAAGAAALVAGAAGALLARRPESAAAAIGLGWAGLFLALAFAWPRLPLSRDVPELAAAARAEASARGARVVGYRSYLQGLPWGLEKVVPVAEFQGELEAWWLPEPRRREIFWPAGKFWEEWDSGTPLVVLVRAADRGAFSEGRAPAHVLACRRKHCVLTNVGPMRRAGEAKATGCSRGSVRAVIPGFPMTTTSIARYSPGRLRRVAAEGEDVLRAQLLLDPVRDFADLLGVARGREDEAARLLGDLPS